MTSQKSPDEDRPRSSLTTTAPVERRRPWLDSRNRLDDTGRMVDSTVLVAVFTGGTAVLTGWVTSRGNARAARIQAEASAGAQQRSRIRELRRTAYLELIEQAHLIGELYWRLGDVYAQVKEPDAQLERIEHLRGELRDAFDPLMRYTRVVALEGPSPVAEAAEAVKEAASRSNSALGMISESVPQAHELFGQAHQTFRAQLEHFIETARSAMNAP